jgi:glycerophosphoryl diester phosphodiesterase
MKKLTLSLALLLCLSACAAPAAQAPTPAPTLVPTAAPGPTLAPSPQPEPTPEPPAAMAEDGEHPRLIAHAGGAIYGYRLTNSLEALDKAFEAGFRFMELDFERTSDGEIVLIHDWEAMAARLLGSGGRRSLRLFRSAPALAGLTLLDLGGLLAWLEEHPGCAIITDVKSEDNPGMLAEIREKAGDLADRFIPQAYSLEQASALTEEGWARVILTVYRIQITPEELGDYLAENPLWAVTMPEARMNGDFAAAVAESGTALYCHTVNTLDFVDAWRDKGLTGIYTDYFEPKHWVD